MWTLILDLLFPRYCLGCHRRGRLACERCLMSLPPAPAGGELWAALDYAHPLTKKLIWKFKYDGLKALAPDLAVPLKNILLEELSERRLLSATKILVVPVPLGPQRERERGYNQAALLAQALVKTMPDILTYQPELLIKKYDTKTQVSLKNRAARLRNLRGAFAAPADEAVKDATILLIDDVSTTGATLEEAKRTLLKAGAAEVVLAALAHGE